MAKRKTKKLPPDPDNQNDARAEWAAAAIEAFRNITGADPCDAVSDLLADLMHYCDRQRIDFSEEMDRASRHYNAETSEDGGL